MYRRLSRHTIFHLLSLPNVMGLGYGFKETGGHLTAQKGIVVLVEKKIPESQMIKAQLVPKSIGGMVSDVIEAGPMYAWGHHPELDKFSSITNKNDNPRRSKWRPAPGGVSIGHYKITSGTLGAVVYDRNSGEKLILSNNHVLANTSNGKDGRSQIGDPILQPGRSAGGTVQNDTIAKLDRLVPINVKHVNVVDAAVARPLEQSLVSPDILEIGTVKGISLPKLGMEVIKSGEMSGVTNGIVRVINMIIAVNYRGTILRFRNQILMGPLSKPGDSGSLVLNPDNEAVGLLFGGSDLFTVMNPITPVMDLLNIRFTPLVSRRRFY